MTRSLSALALSAACTFACATPVQSTESPESIYRGILQAEDDRNPHASSIKLGLGRQQSYLRQAALVALARIGQAGTSSLAARLVKDPDVDVARWSAFALERIGDAEAEAVLQAAVYVSPTPDSVLLALGRSGSATVAPTLGEHLNDKRPEVRAAAALGLGILLKRHGQDVAADAYADRLALLAQSSLRAERFGAVYALSRWRNPKAAVPLVRALADADPEIRLTAVAGIGRSAARPGALDVVTGDRDWRVRAAVVMALKALGTNDERAAAASTRLDAMAERAWARLSRGGRIDSGRSLHELLGIVDGLANLGESGALRLKQLQSKPWNQAKDLPPGVAPDIARFDCALARVHDLQAKTPQRVRSCGRGHVPEWRRLELVAEVHAKNGGSRAVVALQRLAAHQDPRVRLVAVTALGSVESAEATAALLTVLELNDPYMVTAAVEALARPGHQKRGGKRIAVALDHALAKVARTGDASLVVAAVDSVALVEPTTPSLQEGLRRLLDDQRPSVRRRAAAALAGQVASFPAQKGPPMVAMPPPAEERVDLVFETERGPITIRLMPEAAPRHVAVWTNLARAGAYNGTSFHRIVPGFVAQGGCPRGDGWGGPGYTINDEVTPLPFQRGTVGVATNGRDTGGSQLFVMQAWHPHLDGRYTWVGRVVDGIEVVDALQRDDKILTVRVESVQR